MSRKRDTNWSRDEITVLLDSIMEITRLRAADGKRTNSKEVFEYAAKKMGEKGHQSRAEREKCRTKWKKMKEEFTHAKRARGGDTRFKEAPGIQPFYDRIEEFINGNYDNISPHSTIVRRTSSLSNSNSSITRPVTVAPMSPEKRASARIAATHGNSQANETMSPNDNHDTTTTSTTATTIVTRANTTTNNEYPSSMHTTISNGTPPPRLSSGSNNNSSSNTATNSNNASSTSVNAISASSAAAAATTTFSTSQKPQDRTSTNNSELCIYTAYNEYPNSNSASTIGSSHVHSGSNDLISASPPEQVDISYRVSSGCRQITIFGDHDVDIKFRRDRVTINKIELDYQPTEV